MKVDSSLSDVSSTEFWDCIYDNEEQYGGEMEEGLQVTVDNNFGDEDYIMADDEYWKEDAAADAWLARNPGGSRLLYPRLFVVKPHGGKVTTPPTDIIKGCPLLDLPREIRDLIYKHYFDGEERTTRPQDRLASFQDHNGNNIPVLQLSSEDLELKSWLSTSLLQTSRQLRFEALPLLFKTRVLTTEWISVLPRFIEFLGHEGCAMVRYLDLWDTQDYQGWENSRYRTILTNVAQLPRLRHLRIVLSRSFRSDGPRNLFSWYDNCDLTSWGYVKNGDTLKMIEESLEVEWPEYQILNLINAEKFTLAAEVNHTSHKSHKSNYVEFDRNYGALPKLCKQMRTNFDLKGSAQSASTTAGTASDVIGTVSDLGIIRDVSKSPEPYPEPEFRWQDTDGWSDKTIPIYNFIRELLLKDQSTPAPVYSCFPFAPKSSGNVMRDCALCYVNEAHCGHHGLPSQSPNKSTAEGTSFTELSHEALRNACREAINHIWSGPNASLLSEVIIVAHYLGWPDQPALEHLEKLDRTASNARVPGGVEKEGVTAWSALFRELSSRFGPNQGSMVIHV